MTDPQALGRAEPMRLFTAINLPNDVVRSLESARHWLRRKSQLSFVRAENLHITLRFLGDVPDDRTPEVMDALRRVSVQPMQLRIDRFECFPSRGPVRVIAAGIGGDAGAVSQLHDSIDAALETIGLSGDERAYVPHITLARARAGMQRYEIGPLQGQSMNGPEFVASGFNLMRSELHPTGPTYDVLASFPS